MSFKTQIEDLIGSVGDDDLISTSIQDIGAEIISTLPPQKLLAVAKTAAVSSSGLTTAGKRVLAVDKDDLPAREIPAIQKAKYNDTASIYAASDTDAVYYIEDEVVKVNGTAGSGATAGVLHYVPKIPTSDGSTAIVHGGSTVTNFPQEAERLLVLGGAVRCLQRLMADKTSSLPSDVPEPVLGSISESLPTFTVPSAFVLTPAPAGADVDFSSVPSSPSFVSPVYSAPSLGSVGSISLPAAPVAPSSPSFTYTDASVSDIVQPIVTVSDMASMTETAPSYVAPVLSLGATPTISNLTISPSIPVAPALSSNSISFSSTAPTYVQPVVSLGSAPTISDLTISVTIPVAPALSSNSVSFSSTAPVYTGPVVAPAFSTVDTFISTDEDVELASAKIQEINSQIGEYQANIQNQLNVFNDANVEYQADLQVAIQDAQLSSADDGQALQKFSNELQSYQAEVSKEVQEYQQNLEGDLRVWQAERQTDLQKYGSDIQNNLNKFNEDNVEYQADLQVAIQDAQLSSGDDGQLLQKYSNEVQSYQAEVSKEVQEYQQNLEGDLRVWQAERQTDIQKYSADIQSALNSFNEDNIVYQQDIQRKTQNLGKDTQVAIQNAQQEYTSRKANMDKDTQLGLQNALRNYEKSVQEYQADMAKYQAEISSYQAQVNATIQTWVNEEWNQNFQKYQTDYTNSLQNYSANIQKETASFGSDLSVYQQDIQKALQEYQAETGYDMSKYSSEVQAQTSRFTSDLQKNTETFRTSMERYVNELQKVAESNQSKLSKYGADIQNYGSKIQKHGMDYQWKQGQYQQLKAEYNQGLQLLISGGIPQQQGV